MDKSNVINEKFDPERRAFIKTAAAALTLLPSAYIPVPAAAETGGKNAFKIGIIGSGRIGGTLGSLWVNAGHEVLFSSRHPEDLEELAERLGPRARAGMPVQCASVAAAHWAR